MSVRAISGAASLIICASTISGCYPFTVVGRAHTVEAGHLELLAAPGASGIAVADADQNLKPRIEVGARYGVSDRLDLGLRVGDSGALATARFQLLRAPSNGLGGEALIAPGIAYTFNDKLSFELPVLFGLTLHNGHELVLAPRVVEMLDFGEAGIGHPAQFVFVGGSVAFVWQVWSRVALVPELGVLVNVYSEPGFSTFTAAGPALQAALGVLWDR
jgi:hypothetical protein